MRRSLVSVARHELNALVQDTKKAIGGLKHQRESVMQAIQAVQRVGENPAAPPDDTDMLLIGLLEKLNRLNAILDQVMHEAEQMEKEHQALSPEPFIAWTIPLNLPTNGTHRQSQVYVAPPPVEIR